MSAIADRALGLLEHLLVDTESDQLLEALIRALLDPADRVSLLAHGDDTVGPWEALTDPALAPLWALPYAGQYTGGRMPPRLAGESEDAYEQRARDELVHPRGMLRGSARALRIAALPYVTGTRTIRIIERPDDDPWRVLVVARPSEVADVDALTAAVNDDAVIAAGMRAEVELSDAPLINEMTREIDDITAVIDDLTLADVT